MIPPLPDPEELAAAVKEAAATERLEPGPVEKDFHLTRLLWALGERFDDKLLLKGGTCLSKVDLGYHRMSEDADFVLPSDGKHNHKGRNAAATNQVRDPLRSIATELKLRLPQPGGTAYEKNSHVLWEIEYDGRFPPATLVVEVSRRLVLRKPRRVSLKQLLKGELAKPYEDAVCWALDADEVRAEKVRAAFTREEREPRDFYDLELLRREGVDFASEEFVKLVDAKLAELGAAPLADQPRQFGLSDAEIAELAERGKKRLASVVRFDEPAFDLRSAVAAFDGLWKRT